MGIGLKVSGLSVLAHAAYHLIGLRTFFTAGKDECRAWTIHAGDTAPKAAGVIHTDFERGFIKAEVYSLFHMMNISTRLTISLILLWNRRFHMEVPLLRKLKSLWDRTD